MSGAREHKAAKAASDYDDYVRREWRMYLVHPNRRPNALEVTRDLNVRRMLDLGCGAGQEMIPFHIDRGAYCVGIDPASEVGRAGRDLFAGLNERTPPAYLRGMAETLPFAADIFDVVTARVMLHHTDNARALAEIARVLRPGGMLILKFLHARFFLRRAMKGLRTGDPRSVASGLRVLAAGLLYHLSGRQWRGAILGRRTFQTEWMLRRQFRRLGLEVIGRMKDWNPATPAICARKRG